jgi:RNA polymerase sigma factor (sigma-70 family)
MATNQLRRVIQGLRGAALPHGEAGRSDGQLLESYIRSREEAAFAALVQRHGPMVWGVCRRALGSHQDAEDAFQATFLVLVRKAASVRPRDMVGNWLYGVAHQTALKARATTARRRAREKQVAAMPEPALEQQLWDDLLPLLDQELSRLPDRYRAVIVLCDLEGKTRREAAQHFRVPEGTVASRLATARAMLAKRLARHGLPVSATALAALLAQQTASAAVPATVAAATICAAGLFAAGATAGGALSARAAALATSVLTSMLLTKLRIATAVVVVVAGLAAAAVALTRPAPADSAAPVVPVAKDGDREVVEASGLWPQWRGPNRDGVVHGVRTPTKWPTTLREEWKVPVGKGVASPVVSGASVYVFAREKDDEFLLCLDLASGKENWRSPPYPAPYRVGAGEGSGEGRPRSTPAVAAGRVYTFGMTGILSCFDARTGKLLWRKDCQPCLPYGGNSPLVADGLCIVHYGDSEKGKTLGGLTAFDAASGEVKWCYADGSRASSASPILVNMAGERQVVTFTSWGLLGVSVANGKKLWGMDGFSPHGALILTPVQYRDLLIAAGNTQPACAIRLEKDDKGITAKEVWKAKGLPLHMSTPVVAGDLLFGMAESKQRQLFCLDARTGQTLWEGPARMGRTDGRLEGNAAILNAGSAILFLTSGGRLIVVKPTGTAYEPIAEYVVDDTTPGEGGQSTWAHPVFLGDRILVRDALKLRSFRCTEAMNDPSEGPRQ